MKNNLQRELEECTNELITLKGVTHSLIDNLKEQTEKISLEKVNYYCNLIVYFLRGVIYRKDWKKRISYYVIKYNN
jgi:hypothetical protein